jgi:hypothetical protein
MLLSTPGFKRWMSMRMADDENSDFVPNDAETRSDKGNRMPESAASGGKLHLGLGLSLHEHKIIFDGVERDRMPIRFGILW